MRYATESLLLIVIAFCVGCGSKPPSDSPDPKQREAESVNVGKEVMAQATKYRDKTRKEAQTNHEEAALEVAPAAHVAEVANKATGAEAERIKEKRESPIRPEQVAACRLLLVARQQAALIEDPGAKASAYGSIAWAQATAGDIEGAIATAEHIRLAEKRAFDLCHIAEAQAETGDAMGARHTLETAKATAVQISDEREKASTFWTLAETQAKTGDFVEAKTTANQIDDLTRKRFATRAISEALAKAGDIAGARALASQLGNDSGNAVVYLTIAEAQLRGGIADEACHTLEAARAMVAEMYSNNDKLQTYLKIADVQWKAKDMRGVRHTLEMAKAQAAQFEGSYEVSAACAAVAESQAKNGDIAGARKQSLTSKTNIAREKRAFEWRRCKQRVVTLRELGRRSRKSNTGRTTTIPSSRSLMCN